MNILKFLTAITALILIDAPRPYAAQRMDFRPDNAILTIHVSDVKQVWEALKICPFGRIWNDPQVQDLLGKPDLQAFFKQKMLKEMNQETQHLILEELKMLSGEVVFSVSHNKEGDDADIYAIAFINKDDYDKSLVIDQRLDEINDKEKVIMKKDTFQDVEIIEMISISMDDEMGDDLGREGEPRKKVFWQAFLKDTLLESSDKAWLEKTIVQLKGATLNEPKSTPTLHMRLDVKPIFDIMADKEKEIMDMNAAHRNLNLPSPSAMFEVLGLKNINNLKVDIILNKDRMNTDFKLSLTKPYKGLFNLLDTRPVSTGMQIPFVPRDAFAYTVARMDLNGLWNALPGIVRQISPQGMAQFQLMLDTIEQTLGIDLANDLLVHLDTLYVSMVADTDTPFEISGLRLKDEEAVRQTLQKLFSETSMIRQFAGPMLQVEKFRERTMYKINNPQTQETQAMTVAGGYFLVGEEASIHHVLRSLDAPTGPAFYKKDMMESLRGFVPENAFGFQVIDLAKFLKAFAQSVLQNTSWEEIQREIEGELSDQDAIHPFTNLDFTKMPPIEHLMSFFGISMSYSVDEPDGISSKTVWTYPQR